MNKLDNRIDRLNSDLCCDLRFNVYDRMDILSLKLDTHQKQTAERFDNLEDNLSSHRQETAERFDSLEGNLSSHRQETSARFDNLESRFNRLEGLFESLKSDLIEAFGCLSDNIDSILKNHEERLNKVEKNCGLR